MSFKVKKLVKKIISWLGLFFFAVAAYMIYSQLSRYKMDDIKTALMNIPSKNLIFACIASFLGYVSLACYDFLALKYVKRKLSPIKWIFAGFIGFSISNNAGHAIVSGGAIRYRLYTRWRFYASEIVRMVTFSGFTYLWGCFFIIIIGYFLTPRHAFGDSSASHFTTLLTTIISAVGLAVYLSATIFYKKPLKIKEIQFDMPSFKMAVSQMLLGGADTVLASLVLYFPLIAFIDIDFQVYLGIFIIAQVLGVFSQVPGGLGVFEGLFLYLLPNDTNMANILGALIAYRIIYYLLPLVISGIALFSYEWYLNHLRNRVLELRRKANEIKQKIVQKKQINEEVKEG